MSTGWKVMINSRVIILFFFSGIKRWYILFIFIIFFMSTGVPTFTLEYFFLLFCLINTSSSVHFPSMGLIGPALVWSTRVSLSPPSQCIYMSQFSCKYLCLFVAFWVCSPFCFLDLCLLLDFGFLPLPFMDSVALFGLLTQQSACPNNYNWTPSALPAASAFGQSLFLVFLAHNHDISSKKDLKMNHSNYCIFHLYSQTYIQTCN